MGLRAGRPLRRSLVEALVGEGGRNRTRARSRRGRGRARNHAAGRALSPAARGGRGAGDRRRALERMELGLTGRHRRQRRGRSDRAGAAVPQRRTFPVACRPATGSSRATHGCTGPTRSATTMSSAPSRSTATTSARQSWSSPARARSKRAGSGSLETPRHMDHDISVASSTAARGASPMPKGSSVPRYCQVARSSSPRRCDEQ